MPTMLDPAPPQLDGVAPVAPVAPRSAPSPVLRTVTEPRDRIALRQRHAHRLMVRLAVGCVVLGATPAVVQLVGRGGASFIKRPEGVGASESAGAATSAPKPGTQRQPVTGAGSSSAPSASAPQTPAVTPPAPGARARAGAPRAPSVRVPAADAGSPPAAPQEPIERSGEANIRRRPRVAGHQRRPYHQHRHR
jgi:hypothetical protein